MRILFDTSVLVASMVQTHPRHESAVSWLQRARKKALSSVISSHSLLECYAVLTRLPLSPKISPATARQLISHNLLEIAEVVNLSSTDYFSLLQECANQEFSGGIVYDALIFKVATLSKVQYLLTLNSKDFMRFSLGKKDFIITP
jgi:predicted nucleic acid-binding protein